MVITVASGDKEKRVFFIVKACFYRPALSQAGTRWPSSGMAMHKASQNGDAANLLI
ncbi:hypothetical protein FJMB00501_45870 [Enterobacter hormaechei]|nr:hypothetical protein FJMB00501_45870 [Enterobacter hormaechei]